MGLVGRISDGKPAPTFPEMLPRPACATHLCYSNVSPPGQQQEIPMKLKLHHLNLCTTNVGAMDAFYRDVLEMETEPSMAGQRIKTQGYPCLLYTSDAADERSSVD